MIGYENARILSGFGVSQYTRTGMHAHEIYANMRIRERTKSANIIF